MRRPERGQEQEAAKTPGQKQIQEQKPRLAGQEGQEPKGRSWGLQTGPKMTKEMPERRAQKCYRKT
jgi:hypothetical protein